MSIISDILMIMEHKNKKQSELCSYLDINTSTLTNWKVRNTDPPAKFIIPICEFLDISPYYLLTGKEKSPSIELTSDEQNLLNQYKKLSEKEQSKLLGRVELLAEQAEAERQKSKPAPPIKQSKQVIESTNSEDDEPSIITMHYYDNPASAGPGAELGDGRYSEMSVCQNTLTSKADIAIRVKGDSMEPAFYDGDIVLVRLTPSIEVNEIGIFRVDNDYGYIKKKGCDRLISINPERDDIPYSDDQEIVTIGRVIGKLEPEWIIA